MRDSYINVMTNKGYFQLCTSWLMKAIYSYIMVNEGYL